MKTMKLNQRGFSLVELMVVVAIIGILATIGIPQYQKFMAKARQSEAKSHLNAIFQGEASHFTEYNSYTGNIRNIGGGATGQNLRYNAGFENGLACAGASALTPAYAANNNDFISIATADGSPTTWFFAATIAEPTANTTVCGALNTGYTAAAWGNPTNNPNGSGDNDDVFTINEQRVLTQVSVGF